MEVKSSWIEGSLLTEVAFLFAVCTEKLLLQVASSLL